MVVETTSRVDGAIVLQLENGAKTPTSRSTRSVGLRPRLFHMTGIVQGSVTADVGLRPNRIGARAIVPTFNGRAGTTANLVQLRFDGILGRGFRARISFATHHLVNVIGGWRSFGTLGLGGTTSSDGTAPQGALASGHHHGRLKENV